MMSLTDAWTTSAEMPTRSSNWGLRYLLMASKPEGRMMALFTVYFDASGDSIEQPNTIVSGYIANHLQWKMFEDTWTKLHDEYGVKRPFHMAEFVAANSNPNYSKQKHARADYIAIAKDERKALAFLARLAALQMTTVHGGVSCIVPLSLYRSIDSLLELSEVIPPYALAARMCMEKVSQWKTMMSIPEDVECIFEEGDFGQGKFTALMAYEGMPTPIYKKKDDYAGLQAVDHYAWEQAYFLKQHLKDASTEARPFFRMLITAIPKLHVEPTENTLISICHTKGIRPRRIQKP
jgi:hypothetical protein